LFLTCEAVITDTHKHEDDRAGAGAGMGAGMGGGMPMM
jgi:hypothetical protein